MDQPLVTSRRSAPEILSFVDTVFANEAARAGLTSRGQEIEHLAHREEAKGGIEFWTALKPPPTQNKDPYLPVDAHAARRPGGGAGRSASPDRSANGWMRRKCLPGRDRPISPGDIMILLPRREPFGGEVIRQLKLRAIPVAGADRIPDRTDRGDGSDGAGTVRAAAGRRPELAALLRSPLCGITEEELFTLCHKRPGTVWQASEWPEG